jgi:hypothetical protein
MKTQSDPDFSYLTIYQCFEDTAKCSLNLALLVNLVFLACSPPVLKAESFRIVAMEGDPAPDGSSFTGFGSGVSALHTINEGGQVVFEGKTSSSGGIYLWEDGLLRAVVSRGDSAPGGGLIQSFFPARILLNEKGQVMFQAWVEDESVSLATKARIFRADGQILTEIAGEGDEVPNGDGLIADFLQLDFNDAGEVVFIAELENASSGDGRPWAIFRGDGNSLVELVREGDSGPEGGESFASVGKAEEDLRIDNQGRVVFISNLGIMRFEVSDVEAVAQNSSGFVLFLGPQSHAASRSGEIAFRAVIDGDDVALFRSSGATLLEMFRGGGSLPGGQTFNNRFGDLAEMNTHGMLLYPFNTLEKFFMLSRLDRAGFTQPCKGWRLPARRQRRILAILGCRYERCGSGRVSGSRSQRIVLL